VSEAIGEAFAAFIGAIGVAWMVQEIVKQEDHRTGLGAVVTLVFFGVLLVAAAYLLVSN
jgi:hypothetical protein